MRNTKFPRIAIAELALVTGGRKGGYAYSYAWQQQQASQPAGDGGVDVSVATGAQGGQMIQQALQQG